MIPALAIATLLGGSSCALVHATEIDLRDGRLTLHEAIEGPCPALAESGDAVIAALPRQVDRIVLTRAGLVSLVRRRLPTLAIVLPVDKADDEVALRRGEQTDLGGGPACFELSYAAAPQAALTRQDVTMTSCTSARPPLALTYDRRHAIVHTAEAGEAGHYIGPLVSLPPDLIEQGETLRLRVSAGPVTITRDIVAVQSAQTGESLFVRDADGHVFAVPSSDVDEARP